VEFNFEDQYSLLFHLSVNSGEKSFMVKVVEDGVGQKEYGSLIDAHKKFPQFVPTPLLLKSIGRREYVVNEYVDHSAISVALHSKQKKIWAEDLPTFFVSEEAHLYDDHSILENNFHHVLEKIAVYIEPDVYKELCRFIYAADVNRYRELPVKAQHCDFSLNNLGEKDGRLIIFDWEDFGKSKTFGLDFTTFISSALYHNPRDIITFLDGSKYEHLNKIKSAFLEYGNITEKELVPVYVMCIAIFYKLKKELGYGSETISRTKTVLVELLKHYG
jgi:hypothetical protein